MTERGGGGERGDSKSERGDGGGGFSDTSLLYPSFPGFNKLGEWSK